jgi:polar amino acid transport system substrate-binding protein
MRVSLIIRTAMALAVGFVLMNEHHPAVAEDLHALLPANVRDAGQLTAAAIPSYPPFVFVDANGESTGIDTDLFRAICDKLGVKAVVTPIEFATILPSVQAGRFDVGIGAFFDTPERRKVVRFIDDLKAIDGLLTRPGNPDKISVDDMCGKTISASKSSVEDINLHDLSKQCVDKGKPPIDVVALAGTPAQVVAVKSGRVAAANVTAAVVAYMASQDAANLEVVPGIVPDASGITKLEGVIVQGDRTDLQAAMGAALNALIADGTYAKIMQKWNVPRDLWLAQTTLD